VLAVPGLSRATAPELELQGERMLDCSGLPCVEVTAGTGAHLRMLIDIGNARSVLDKAVAQRLSLTLTPFVGRNGTVRPEYSTATLADTKLGGAALGDLSVLVADLAPGIKKGDTPVADGSLSYTAFGPRLLRMDYRRHRVELSTVLSQEVPCPADCGTITLPTFGQHGPPIVVTTGFSVNGRAVTVQIDTLYSGTMLIYPTSVDRLALSAQQTSKALRSFPFTDGGVQMIEGQAELMAFGGRRLVSGAPVYFATPEVHIPDGMFDGTVGHELFTGHVLTFDFHSHHFWIS
jgi:hypothetical protein